MIYGIKCGNATRACTTIEFGIYDISIAMDDSCGACETFHRSDIRVYRIDNGEDVTNRFCRALFATDNCNALIPGEADYLLQIMEMIRDERA